jgi:hypothetical protein
VVPDFVVYPPSWPRLFFLATCALVFGFVLAYARADVEEERVFRRSMGAIKVTPPAGAPKPSQESVDLAIAMFGIEIPPSALHPEFDPKLEDRGLTTRATFMDRAKVTIGPAAFASWGLLGSTLAHELEVHCNQSFAVIWLLDLLRMDGVAVAEREAYQYEIAGAERFSLDASDVQLISETVEYYYPEEKPRITAGLGGSLRSWLARNFLSADQVF